MSHVQTCQLLVLGDDPAAAELVTRASDCCARIGWAGEHSLSTESLPWNVDRYTGKIRFLSRQIVECDSINHPTLLTAPRIVIATGSAPRRPNWVERASRLIDAGQMDRFLHYRDDVEKQLAIIGLGQAGITTIQALRSWRCTLHLIDAGHQHRQEEIRAALGEFNPAKVHWRLGTGVIGAEESTEGLRLYFDNGGTLLVDAGVCCLGQVGCTQDLHLHLAGLMSDDRGKLWCDDRYATWTPGISALGEVVGYLPEQRSVSAAIDILLEEIDQQLQTEMRL